MSGATTSALRAVFFDLDDTLCDTIGTRQARVQRACQVLCRAYPHLDADELLARVMRPAPERIVWGVPRTLAELGLLETPAGREALGIWFFEGCYDLLKPLPGVVPTLAELRRSHLLGVITNGDGKLQRAKWLRLSLGIDLVVISAECGFEKPDPRIFAHALSLAGVEPHEAIFVGDRLDVDVGGAKAAGMRAVWFNHWGGHLDNDGPQPDAVIERFSRLPEVLEQL
ncbi:MAG: HAD-IA family hydrolase [Chloroflexi bacterium]|nr:HAD-IA family hydrolase [Chloroflexota bacterium]